MLAIAVAGVLVVLHERDRDVTSTPESSPTTDVRATKARDRRVTDLLAQLTPALDDPRGLRDASALAAPAGVDRLRAIESNVRRIGITDLRLRYLGPSKRSESATLQAAGSGEETWTADVRLSWRIGEYEDTTSRLDLTMVVVDDDKQARFGGIVPGAEGDRVPIWLLQPLEVRKDERALVMASAKSRLRSLLQMANRAVEAVGRVLPDWRGSLVLEEPSDRGLLDQAIGAGSQVTTQLAGITTTADGSARRLAPEHVLLNPEVFDKLGPEAAQIVVSHEATHVATAGATATMPQWLIEGFADYVALRDLGVPVQTSASQILAQVRRDGPPRRLPTDADFAGDSTELGADYEAAWLAAKLIADRYGEQKLVEFYRATDDSGDIGKSFREILGTTQRDFTRSWSAYVASLA
ncbi:MAG: hypothetical protein QM655_13755 [Nocardioidaceae bacterium]